MLENFVLREETVRDTPLAAGLAALLERSVRASHDFHAEGGVEFYRRYAEEACASIPLLITARRSGRRLYGHSRRAS